MFGVAGEQRIIDLLRDVARGAEPVGDGQGFHQVPAGVVGATDIANLAGPYKIVERPQGFLERRERIEAVGLIEVDVIRAETAQAGLAGFDEVAARESGFVGAGFETNECFSGEDNLLPASAQRLAEDFFGLAERINVGRVEEIHAGLDADFDQAARLVHLHVAHRGKTAFAAQGHGAKAQG